MTKGILLVLACLAVAGNGWPLEEHTDDKAITWIGPIRKCPNAGDTLLEKCVAEMIKDLTPLVGNGLPEIELQPLDPIRLNKFLFDRSYGPVNITVLAKNTIITGLVNFNKFKFRVDTQNKKVIFDYEVPHLRIQSNYKLSGSAFFYPLTGAGPVTLDMFNFKAQGEIVGKITQIEQKEVVLVDKLTFYKSSIDNLNLFAQGLFNGNGMMSTGVHYIAKQFGREIYELVRPDVEEFAANLITHDLLNPILKHLPHVADYIKN